MYNVISLTCIFPLCFDSGIIAVRGAAVLGAERLRELYRIGDFLALDQVTTVTAEAKVWAARCRLEQGELGKALALLREAERDETNDEERQIWVAQRLGIEAQVTGEVEAALAAAETLGSDCASPALLVRVYCLRVLLLAELISLRPRGEAVGQLRALLPAIQLASPLHAALAGRWLVHGAEGLAAKRAAAAECAALAKAANVLHVGGEAWVTVAQAGRQALAPEAEIRQAIDSAEHCFAAAGYRPGAVSVAAERIRLDRLLGKAKAADLEALLPECEALAATGLIYAIHSELATLLLPAGRAEAAQVHREAAEALAKRAGMGSLFRVRELDQIERLRGSGRPIAAVALCDETLAGPLPKVVRGHVLQSKARALAEVGAAARALAVAQAAEAAFEGISAVAQLSTLASEMALYIVALEEASTFQTADALLARAEAGDFAQERPEQGLEKARYRAQLGFQAFERIRDQAALDHSSVLLETAFGKGRDYPEAVRAVHEAGCWQLAAQIEAARADMADRGRNAQTGRERMALFREANDRAIGLALAHERVSVAAGCAMMAGLVELNAANDAWRAGGQVAEGAQERGAALLAERQEAATAAYEKLDLAAESYAGCGQAVMAARARAFQAEVTANSAMAPAIGDPGRLLELAWRHLEEADGHYETRRAELELADPNETLLARQALSQATERLVDLALRIKVVQAPDLPVFWEWLQRAKARSLTDALSRRREAIFPIRFAEAQAALQATPRPVILVDWCVTAGQIYLLVCRPGEPPAAERLALSAAELQSRLAAVAGRAFGATLGQTPELLSWFSDLVAPLEWMTPRDALLALSPMGVIGALPLHALDVGSEPLIRRNPVMWVPNHAIGLDLWDGPGASRKAAVFGDPTSDLTLAPGTVDGLAVRFGVRALTGAAVTAAAIEAALCEAEVLHYQGHARHDVADPLASALDLAQGPMTASQILAGPASSTRLAVLGACESGVARIARGNEPNGLTQAFLLRGVARVVSSLWVVEERAAATYLDVLHERLDHDHPADAHRAATGAALDRFGPDRPDLWAPFILTGHLFAKSEIP